MIRSRTVGDLKAVRADPLGKYEAAKAGRVHGIYWTGGQIFELCDTLAAELAAIRRQADDATEYVLATQNATLREKVWRMRALLEEIQQGTTATWISDRIKTELEQIDGRGGL
jgi:hypothetical protein